MKLKRFWALKNTGIGLAVIVAFTTGWHLAPKPAVPEVGSCYEPVDVSHKSDLYQVEKVIKADTRSVTTIFTFPNVDGYAKYKWYKSKGNLLDEVPLEWFKRTRQPRECPW